MSESFTLTPSTVAQGNVLLIRVAGTGTNFTGTPFSASGSAGSSIASQVILSPTSATFVFTAGAVGTCTISDGTSSTPLTITAAPVPIPSAPDWTQTASRPQ